LEINSEAFGKFCKETIDIYFDAELGAPWYPMPPTLHRILFHGKEIIESCPVPIGWTSEEGSEANNKFAREFEANHSRKTSNEDNLLDLFNRLTDISDPVLVAQSIKVKKVAKNDLTPDMEMLIGSGQDKETNNALERYIDDSITDSSVDVGNISLTEL
jgi:hypothetical protein